VRYPENAAQGWPQDEDWFLTHPHTEFADQRRTASLTSVREPSDDSPAPAYVWYVLSVASAYATLNCWPSLPRRSNREG
jgi:hypothetical protein